MRMRAIGPKLTVNAIAGTYVVLLGLDMAQADCDGLLGFAIHRIDRTEDEAYWLRGLKTFAATDPGFPAGSSYSTRKHPIQGFTWSDLSAKPGHDYTYRVVALKGTPQHLTRFAETSVDIQTEDPEGGDHDIYFNRGSAASQEYTRRFGDRTPSEVGPAAFEWLSRGLWESMVAFIEQATGPGFELQVCAYEFHYAPVLQALADARNRGATVRIIYDRRSADLGSRNDLAIQNAGIADLCTKRTQNPSAISHNKFIVLLEHGQAKSVLTGGTNFSEGGIFGHSNAVHVVQDPAVAAAYEQYWNLLKTDPAYAALRGPVRDMYNVPTADPRDPPDGTGAVFSPRMTIDALEWYAHLAAQAEHGLFMTFAFGMHPLFQNVYATSQAEMRFALMEQATRPNPSAADRMAEERAIAQLRFLPENRFAIGSHLKLSRFDRWVAERLTGLNTHVKYVHTKYMLIDPLGDHPVIVAGSANFSAASSKDNDENMLIIRGDRRVADIYLGEFMRLYKHYAFREWASKQPAGASSTPQHLRTDDWWAEYFGDNERAHQREYFA